MPHPLRVAAVVVALALPSVATAVPPAHVHDAMPMDHSTEASMDASMSMPMDAMHGQFGAYPMTREGSGTSWQPDATPMMG